MPSNKSDNKSTCGCLILAAVVIGIIVVAVNSSKSNKSSSNVEFLGADPHAFVSALDQYTFPPKPKLSKSDETNLMTRFNSFVASKTYPEDTYFSSVLDNLDGAASLDSVETAIEKAAPSYKSGLLSSKSTTNSVIQSTFTTGNTAYEAGNYASAALNYMAVLKLAPGHMDARNNLGLCELHLGNNVAALMHFHLILAASPQYLGAEQNLSVTLERIGLSARALTHAKNVVKTNAKLPMGQYNLGWFESQNKDYSGSTSSYNKALAEYSKYAKALHGLTLNKIATGQKLASSDLNTLSAAEKSAYSAKPASSGSTAAVKTVKPVSTVWWWILMVVAILILIILWLVAVSNNKSGATAWGLISIIGIIIAVILFAIFFHHSSTYSTVLWCFVIFDIIALFSTRT